MVGESGPALANVSVGPRYLAGRDCCNTVYVHTDQLGRFDFSIADYAGMVHDTLTMFLIAQGFLPPDSVPFVARFGPVGERTPVTQIEVRIKGH